MGETLTEVYENAAGLLSRMGYVAFSIPAYIRTPMPAPVVALATDADPVLVGYAIGQVAVSPEAFLPTTRKPGGRPKGAPAGPPLGIWFSPRNRTGPKWPLPSRLIHRRWDEMKASGESLSG